MYFYHRTLALPTGITHVSSLHSIFGDFADLVEKGAAEINRGEASFAIEFCLEMHYAEESGRNARGNNLLETYLDCSLAIHAGDPTSDGTASITTSSGQRMLLINYRIKE